MLKDIEKYIYTNKFNHLYLYTEITSTTVQYIRVEVEKLNKTENNKGVYVKPKAIVLHINSPGGDLFSGIALMNIVNNSRIPIIVLIEGLSASAATLVTVIAKYRIMLPYSFILIHQLSMGMYGQHEELQFESEINNKIMDIMYNFYSTFTKLPKTKIKEVLRHDLYFTAEECLQYGLIDKILIPTPNIVFDQYYIRNPEYDLTSDILKIKTNFNNLYFYGADSPNNIDYEFRKTSSLQYILSFNSNKNNASSNTNTLISIGSPKPILLNINENEPLRYLVDILPIMNTILLSRIPIISFINSPVTEKTIIYTILCYKKFIYKYAYVTLDFLKLKDFSKKHEDTIKNTELLRKTVYSLLKQYTKLPVNIMKNLFKERFFLSAEECVKYGICDEVIS
jgi:ATP-dependent Clp endopeptidase proteolytic subunit ClpP